LLWALNAVDPWQTAWALSGTGTDAVLPLDPSTLLASEDVVAAALGDQRVVILMEAHRHPETRYFGARLLLALRAAGATHLAFETSRQATLDRFAHSGQLRPDTEVYAFDPSRAQLLRTACALWLRLVAFDYPSKGHRYPSAGITRALLTRLLWGRRSEAETVNREREWHMAHNIVEEILLRDPAARVVVWTGGQHAMKRTPPGWIWQIPSWPRTWRGSQTQTRSVSGGSVWTGLPSPPAPNCSPARIRPYTRGESMPSSCITAA
jgi:hypothetical protein